MSQFLRIEINPAAKLEQHTINEQHSCYVVDDYLLNADEVVAFASEQKTRFEMPQRAYPGKVLDLDGNTTQALHRDIRQRLSRKLGFARSDMHSSHQLSLATLQPRDFSWIQRLCHSDPATTDGRNNYAIMVYLFDNPELGGTGFYRWRDERFWQSMAARQIKDPQAGLSILQTRYDMFNEPARYMTESNEAAELLLHIPARFNRMICYSGSVPHSAYITRPEQLSDDPASGRLTLNSFASAWPKKA